MKEKKIKRILVSIFLGDRYTKLTSINDQVRYMTMNAIFMAAIIPLTVLGTVMLIEDVLIRAIINYFIAFLCLTSLILIRSKMPLRLVPVFPVSVFGAFCVYLLYTGDLHLWAAIWLFSFPAITIFLCQIFIGIIESIIVFIGILLILYAPFIPVQVDFDISIRIVLAYFLVTALAIIYESISLRKDKLEAKLKVELAQERDIVQTMKNNIQQGIFLMDKEYKILPQYSQPLVNILSYYDSELAGKNFLDILSSSLDAKQLQTMQSYYTMMFEKSKSSRVLESVNPISEFDYHVDDRIKVLTTKFHLVEQADSEAFVIGIIQDITREKEFEKELQEQRLAKETEMKNMFDVIQIDPIVFGDFIDDTENNFNYINSILKDRTLTERQVVTKFFQNVHAIKSNALILGLESLGLKLHSLEDDIKKVSSQDQISLDDVLRLTVKFETIMQEKDTYMKIVNKIESFKVSNRLDTVLLHSLIKAVEKTCEDTQKKANLKAGHIDIGILESKLRKPIKDILFQCVRNSIFHGIEPEEERIKKNKKPEGLLVFSIKNIDGNAEITFSDDGKGLNWEKIKTKYLELHPDAKNIDKKVLLSSIFSPEFSTSEETTSVAGRGVGLSHVKDLVKANNGTVNVNSSEAGLIFKFTFPLTS